MTYPDVGEVWFIELNERQGHEQSGNRPGVIIAVSYGMYITIPFTTQERAFNFPHTHVVFPDESNGLREESYALIFQISALSEERMIEKWGVLSDSDMVSIKAVLQDLFGLH